MEPFILSAIGHYRNQAINSSLVVFLTIFISTKSNDQKMIPVKKKKG
jgi:hypothetical protein